MSADMTVFGNWLDISLRTSQIDVGVRRMLKRHVLSPTRAVQVKHKQVKCDLKIEVEGIKSQ